MQQQRFWLQGPTLVCNLVPKELRLVPALVSCSRSTSNYIRFESAFSLILTFQCKIKLFIFCEAPVLIRVLKFTNVRVNLSSGVICDSLLIRISCTKSSPEHTNIPFWDQPIFSSWLFSFRALVIQITSIQFLSK